MSLRQESIDFVMPAFSGSDPDWHPVPGDAVRAHCIFDDNKSFGIVVAIVSASDVMVMWTRELTNSQRSQTEMARAMANEMREQEDTNILNALKILDGIA